VQAPARELVSVQVWVQEQEQEQEQEQFYAQVRAQVPALGQARVLQSVSVPEQAA
jgi:hypothetical protein